MKATCLKSQKRSESRNDKNLGIQTYGENNDYPQRCKEILLASGTGSACCGIYAKFIKAQGFSDTTFYQAKINEKGQTNDYILSQIANDLAEYGGFALHLNYNALCRITEVQHVPFETIRFEKLNDEGDFNRVATHPDWGRRMQDLRRFKKEDIKFYDFYNPNPVEIIKQSELAGGFENWNGQIYYYSTAGDKIYPNPIYDAVLTDMSTEEGISNQKYRNARFGFYPSCMVIDKRNKNQDKEDKENPLEKSLGEFQGDINTGKMIFVEVESEDEIPTVVPFETRNIDKEFDYTEKSTKDNIGRRFMQPPILRGEDVGANFGADLITNAYDFYNSITEIERLVIESVFSEVYKNFYIPVNNTNNYTIQQLTFKNINTNVNNS
jgi:hypothetical protein